MELFPVINVDKVKDIPKDYPGAMGVPITFLDKYSENKFEIIDILRPKVDGRELYRRILIRNLSPELPEEIDLAECLEKAGTGLEAVEVVEGRRRIRKRLVYNSMMNLKLTKQKQPETPKQAKLYLRMI